MLIIFVPFCREQPHQLCFILVVWLNYFGYNSVVKAKIGPTPSSPRAVSQLHRFHFDGAIEALGIVARAIYFDYGYHILVVYFYTYLIASIWHSSAC